MKKHNLIPIGTFRLGNVNVRLVADPLSEGGNFVSLPSPVITVGLHQNTWPEVVTILLHEVMEFSLMMRELKYRAVPVVNFDCADVSFFLTHDKFGRVCSDTGAFIANALPDLAKVHNRNLKNK